MRLSTGREMGGSTGVAPGRRTARPPLWTRQVLRDLATVDRAVYQAVAAAPTVRLDPILAGLSRTADHSKLWLAGAGLLAAVGGRTGRRAAADGLASIAAASAASHAVKWMPRRRRPDRVGVAVPAGRWVRMPTSHSWPSGHSASAFAFASAVGAAIPVLSLPLHLVAAAVAYSRVHTGVHYPADAIAGAILGTVAGALAPHAARGGSIRRRASTWDGQPANRRLSTRWGRIR